jgi:Phage integrase family
MCVGSPIAGTWSSSQSQPDDEFETDTWLTFRRTYSSWAHQKGVPPKVVAAIMGHTKIDTTLNVYTQVLDGAAREAADRVGSELARIGQTAGGTTTLTH